MNKIHSYHAYGLEISSEVPIPELPEGRDIQPDVHIYYGNPPMSLEGTKTIGKKFEAQPQQLLIKTDKIARILISRGNTIEVQPLPGAQEHQVHLLLMGWGLGALFLQRETAALHGSVICKGDEGFVICAPSGTGKSTLTVAFTQKGYQYLDDNIAVFSPSANKPMVLPGIPQIKLWEDALEKFEIERSESKPLFPDVQKYQIPFIDQFRQNPVEVRVIYILSPTKLISPGLIPLSGVGSLKMALSQIFCSQFISDFSQHKQLFSRIISIANMTKIVRVNLPEPRCTPNDLADFIEKDFQSQTREPMK